MSRIFALAIVVLAIGATSSAEAHHWRHYRYADDGYAIQLPRRYTISPAQNFDAWYLSRGRRGWINNYQTPCAGDDDRFWDGSRCVLWPEAIRNSK